MDPRSTMCWTLNVVLTEFIKTTSERYVDNKAPFFSLQIRANALSERLDYISEAEVFKCFQREERTHFLSAAFESISLTTSADLSTERVDEVTQSSVLSASPLSLSLSVSVKHPDCSSDRSVNLAVLLSCVQLGVVGVKWKCNTTVSRRCQNDKYDISLLRFY